MRCCPACYSKVRPTVYGTATTGTSLEIKYKIQCRNCGFGCDKAGSVIVQYDDETMNPIADDHGLRNLLETGILFCEILIEKGWLIYEVHILV